MCKITNKIIKTAKNIQIAPFSGKILKNEFRWILCEEFKVIYEYREEIIIHAVKSHYQELNRTVKYLLGLNWI